MTKSLSPNGLPSHWRAYRSSTRPALASKWGSRGKIHERWLQGRMASAASHRQIVVPEISATRPRRSTSARISGTCSLDRGRPRRFGSSHAMALTSTVTSGGKNRGATSPGPFFEPGKTLLEETLSPLRHDLAAGVQACSDLIIAQPFGREENHLGSHH